MIEGFYATDFQVHSFRSHDGKASIAEHCVRAVALGLDAIGFSEHKDFDPNDPVVDYFDYDAYRTEIEAERKRWGDRLLIRAGVEIDYQSWFKDAIAAYLNAHPFDFVIGSVHYVNRVMIMTPEYNASRDARSAYGDYFRAVRDSVQSGLFDILGHLEYANRRGVAAWGPYETQAYRDDLIPIFDAMIEREVALEINTAGLHQGVGLTYPAPQTVALYRERGGNLLSFGSDAHRAEDLAYEYPQAVKIALANDLTAVSVWEKRVRATARLDAERG